MTKDVMTQANNDGCFCICCVTSAMFDAYVIISLISSENQGISWVSTLSAAWEGELSTVYPEKLCNKTEQSRFLLLRLPSAPFAQRYSTLRNGSTRQSTAFRGKDYRRAPLITRLHWHHVLFFMCLLSVNDSILSGSSRACGAYRWFSAFYTLL